ncbi:hypothetical protein [Thermocatellispora tengchongensis]|uniref:hypothetical protein n=1 Tax=Thermocatellispora tengchongensis TaxID=1073253 RepID=UPI003639E7C6
MTEYRWLLPSVLLGSGAERGPGRVRRSARDWFVDITLFVVTSLFTLIILSELEGDPLR